MSRGLFLFFLLSGAQTTAVLSVLKLSAENCGGDVQPCDDKTGEAEAVQVGAGQMVAVPDVVAKKLDAFPNFDEDGVERNTQGSIVAPRCLPSIVGP